MNLLLDCIICRKEFKKNNPIFVELNESGIYNFTCSKGHDSEFILQNNQFELLFDIGVMAFLDGYKREAVLNYISSLERFYEYFIKALLIDSGVNDEGITQAWKKVSSQSERQYGMFIGLYVNKFKKLPFSLKEKDIKFRNDVVHKGKFPSFDETYDFGVKVFTVLKGLAYEIKNYDLDVIDKARRKHIDKLSEERKNDNCFDSGAIATIIDMSYLDHKVTLHDTFKKELINFKHHSWSIYGKRELKLEYLISLKEM